MQSKKYQCSNVELPSIDDFQSSINIFEFPQNAHIEEILEYQICIERLKRISTQTGLSVEEIISQAVALYKNYDEAKKGKNMVFLNE